MSDYRIELTPDEGNFHITCPVLEGVNSFGDDDADCIAHGRDAIEEWLAGLIHDGDDIPVDDGSAPAEHRTLWVTLPALTALKVGLYQAQRAAGVTRAELTRRLGWNRNSVDRLFDLNHASRLDQIEAAAGALGLEVTARIATRQAA